MKGFVLIAWLTQLGFSVALPPAGFILLAVWLRDSCGWGDWVLWVGIVLGVAGAIEGLRSSFKAMVALAGKQKTEKPPISFHNHE